MPRCERERSPIANSGRIKVPDREVHVDTVVNACVQVPATRYQICTLQCVKVYEYLLSRFYWYSSFYE